MRDIGKCAMRFDLARQVREKLKSLVPFLADTLGQLDLYESRSMQLLKTGRPRMHSTVFVGCVSRFHRAP